MKTKKQQQQQQQKTTKKQQQKKQDNESQSMASRSCIEHISVSMTYTELLKKPDTFQMLQTSKKQIIELSRYAYFNNKTLESILRKNIFIKYRT